MRLICYSRIAIGKEIKKLPHIKILHQDHFGGIFLTMDYSILHMSFRLPHSTNDVPVSPRTRQVHDLGSDQK